MLWAAKEAIHKMVRIRPGRGWLSAVRSRALFFCGQSGLGHGLSAVVVQQLGYLGLFFFLISIPRRLRRFVIK